MSGCRRGGSPGRGASVCPGKEGGPGGASGCRGGGRSCGGHQGVGEEGGPGGGIRVPGPASKDHHRRQGCGPASPALGFHPERAWPFTHTHVHVRIAASGLTGGPSRRPRWRRWSRTTAQPGWRQRSCSRRWSACAVPRCGRSARWRRGSAPTGRGCGGWRSRYAGLSVGKLSQEQGGSGRGRVSLPLAPFGLRCSGVPVTEMVGVDPGWCQPSLDTGARVRSLELGPLSVAPCLGGLSCGGTVGLRIT